jgi:hypothetical protein
VHVDSDEGLLKTATIRVVRRRAPEGYFSWNAETTETARSCQLPAVVRVSPGEEHTVTAHSEGYEPKTLPIPPDKNELRIRLTKAQSGARVTVTFTETEPKDHPSVLVVAEKGLERHERTIEPGAVESTPIVFALSEGMWTVYVSSVGPVDRRAPARYSDNIEIRVEQGKDLEIRLPPLFTLPARDGRRIYAGTTQVSGKAAVVSKFGTQWSNYPMDYADVMGVVDGTDVHRWQYKDFDDQRVPVLHLPERIRVTIPESVIALAGSDWSEAISVSADFAAGSCDATTAARTVSLWAPEGACTVKLGGLLRHSWQITVKAGEVVSLVAPEEFSIVQILQTKPDFTLEDWRLRSQIPYWIILRKSADGEERVASLDSWHAPDVTRLALLPGDYIARPGFGPSYREGIAFTAGSGEVVVNLPQVKPHPCNGTVRVPLPKGFRGAFDTDCKWTWDGKDSMAWQVNMFIHARVVDDRLSLFGLPLDSSGVLIVTVQCKDAYREYAWKTQVAVTELTNTEPRDVAATWTAITAGE